MSAATRVTGGAAELRLAFDRGFAEPVNADTTVMVDLLAIRVGGEACAIRLRETAGLFVDKKITRLPGGAPALLGISGFRGAIMPVFSLQILLGRATAVSPRWLVVAADTAMALAFDAFEGQMRLSPDAILPRPPDETNLSYARELVRMPSGVCPLIHLPSVLGSILGSHKPEAAPSEER